jgi:hypothetical protein
VSMVEKLDHSVMEVLMMRHLMMTNDVEGEF